ncbi:MAG: alkaline phosphatase family protein [Oligoflexia bacterium]|nr:alkaline phosphatase family protein [Oligoflexia bacterium]
MKKNKNILVLILVIIYTTFFASVLLSAATNNNNNKNKNNNKMIIISIDGMNATYYTQSSFPLPTIKQLAKEGVTASEVKTVFPSVTYANHTSMMTGHYPDKHGIYANKIFDPESGPQKKWLWATSRIKVPTLWQKARENKKTVAMLMWPVSLGTVENWIVPEIFPVDGMRSRTQWDYTMERATPGLMNELDKALKGKRPTNDDEWDQWDTDAAVYIRDKYKPDLLMIHINMMDNAQHEFGRDGVEVREAMKKTDDMVKKIIEGVDKKSTCIVVLGDHGLADYKRVINPNVLLVKGGFIKLDDSGSGQIKSWEAVIDNNGPGAGVYVKSAKNKNRVLKYLSENARVGKGKEKELLYNIIDKSKLKKLNALPDASFALEAKKGYTFGTELTGELIVEEKRVRGDHGYLPTNPDMNAGFIISGCGITNGSKNGSKNGKSIGKINIVDVAPTLAKLMGFSMGHTSGQAIPMARP